MSCPLEAQVLRLGTELLSRDDTARLENHARGCAECSDALYLIESTAKLFRETTKEAAAHEPNVEQVRRIEQALVDWHGRRDLWKPARFVLACAATAAATFILSRPILFERTPVQEAKLFERPVSEETELANRQTQKVAASAKVRAGRARVVTGSDAELVFQPSAELSVLSLQEGHIAITVDALESPERYAVATPDARIETIAATFQVKADPRGTVVYVDRGAVRVEAPNRAPVELRDGQKWVIEAPEKNVQAPTNDHPKREEARTRATPSKPEDLILLMRRADGARTRGELETALADYLRAAEDPRGAAFVEEALLRAARIEVALGRPSRAETELARAARHAPQGTLLPERTALAASIARAAGNNLKAAQIIESLSPNVRSISLSEERLAVARAIRGEDPSRAKKLAAPLVEIGPGAAIKQSAEALLEMIEEQK